MGKRFFTLLAAALAVLVVAISAWAIDPPNPGPSIAGNAAFGEVLTGIDGTWTGDPAPVLSRSWLRCDAAGNNCVATGDIDNSYTLGEADVGQTMRFQVAGDNGDGTPQTATSAQTAPVVGVAPTPPGGGIPAPTGTLLVGATLDGHTGAWGGVPPPGFAYQWIRCDGAGANCADLAGQIAWQYVLQPADAGQTVKVRVTGTNPYGQVASESPVVGPITQPPFNQTAPVVAGAAVNVGQPLNVTPGSWGGFPAPVLTENWQRCDDAAGNGCVDVGGVDPAYVLQLTDAGKFMRVREAAVNGVAPDAEIFSNILGPVTLAPLNTGVDGMIFPSITDGNDEFPMRGELLTASSGIWFAYPAPTILHKWQRCPLDGNLNNCVDIVPPFPVQQVFTPGGQPVYAFTGITQYVVTDLDIGSLLRVVVLAENELNPGAPVELASAVTLPVQGAPVNRTDLAGGPAGLTGQAERGQALTATSGLWTGFWVAGLPPLHVTHHWERLVPDGSVVDLGTVETPLSPAGVVACTELRPCTSASIYTLGEADLGSQIRVTITVSNGGGPVEVVLVSDVVVGSPIIPLVDGQADPDSLPEITGVAISGLVLLGSAGSWSAFPSDTLEFSYQWLRCLNTSAGSCSEIGGAQADTYTATAQDVSKRLRLRVTARNGILPDGVALSAPTPLVSSPQPGVGGPGADLAVQLSTITSGGGATYSVKARNVGTAAANDVVVEATLAPGVQIVAASTESGSCSGTVCNLGSLGAGALVSLGFQVRATQSGVYPVTISIRSSSPDVNPFNNSVTTSSLLRVSGVAPRATNPDSTSGGAQVAGSKNVKKVPPTLKAMKVKKTWVLDTKFSLLSGAAKLQLTVTEDRDVEPLRLLKGSRLGPIRVKKNLVNKKPVTTLTFRAKKSGNFPIKIILPAKAFSLAKSYVVRLTATNANGQSSTLDLGFRGAKLVKKKTTLRYGGTSLVAASKFFVPKDKAKIGVKSWLTKGKSQAQIRVLKGSQLGKTITKSARRQLAYKATKRGQYRVKMVLPVKGFAGKLWYTIHVDSRPKNAAWTTYQIRFKASKAVLNRLSRAVASAAKKKTAPAAKKAAAKKGPVKKAKK